MTWYATKAEHNAAHARMQVLEAIDKYRQSTLLTRQSINVIINHLNSGEDTKCWDSLDVRTDIYYYEFENFGVNQNAVPETVTIRIQ